MAQDKKSFVLYCDLIHTVKKMPKDKAGELFLHILQYVNDLNPEINDLLIEVAFEPIKQQLKRDLQKYDRIRERNSENGKKGGRPPKEDGLREKPTGLIGLREKPKKADNDNVSDSVNVKRNNIEERKLKFASLVESFKTNYPIEMLRDFYSYWSEHSSQGVKMRFEKETVFDINKRLINWHKRSDKFDKPTQEIDPLVKHVQETIQKYSS